MDILVVEDEADVAAGLAGSLRRLEGVRSVKITESAELALEELRRRSYALVLCDVRLKGMDGLELLSRVRQAQSPTRVLMMTAFASEHIRLHARRLGADGLLEKPFDLQLLHQEVRRVLRTARREQPSGALRLGGASGQTRHASLGSLGESEA